MEWADGRTKQRSLGRTCGIVLYNMAIAELDMSVATNEEEGSCDRRDNPAAN